VTGDKSAGTGSVAVFDEVLCLRSVASGAGPVDRFGCLLSTDPSFIERTVDRIAFDRKTGLAVIDPGRYRTAVDGDSKIAHVGLGYTFPIDTRKTSYPFFDPVAGRAFPMQYQSTQRLDGLTVYEFRQSIPASPIKINGLLPGTYTDTRTVWVEPTTGVIIKGSEAISQTFTQGGMTAFKGTLVFTDASVKSQAKFAKDQLAQVRAIRVYLPLAALIIGLGLLVGALVLMRRRRGTPVAAVSPDGQLAHIDGGAGQDPSP
jgi:hypothetical protein